MASWDPPDADADAQRRHQRRGTWVGVGVGVSYGLLARLAFGHDAFVELFGVMTLAFLVGVPVAIGFLTVYLRPGEPPGPVESATTPLLATLGTIVGALVLAWEGLICAIVWLPAFLLLAMAAGATAGTIRRSSGRVRPLVLVSVAIVPFMLAPIEHMAAEPSRTHTLTDRVVIEADAATVWAEIRDVAPISAAELGPSFAYRIGFPRPVEARLVGSGVGSVRHATFEGGVTFVERVTDWEPGRALAFSIDASAVPSTTFDQHVAVGGRYFDVLDGRYQIRPLGPGRIELTLASTHRLSTRFNAYTRLWTDLFMRDIQQTILGVVQARSERAVRTSR